MNATYIATRLATFWYLLSGVTSHLSPAQLFKPVRRKTQQTFRKPRPRDESESDELSNYLDRIWAEYGPDVYNSLIAVAELYRSAKADTTQVVQMACNLLWSQPELLDGFHLYLPSGHSFKRCGDFDQNHCVSIHQPPEGPVLRAAFGLASKTEGETGNAEVDHKIVNLLRKALTDPQYKTAAVTLQGGDARRALVLMQKLLDDTEMWSSTMITEDVKRKELLRLLVKLSQIADYLPSSLFLEKVIWQGGDHVQSGSFADIYLGRFKGKPVALKRLRFFMMMSPGDKEETSKAFAREALLWRQLRHPNIVPLIGIDLHNFDNSTSMVIPWMENGNLRDFLKKSTPPLSTDRLNQLILYIGQGLNYLHQENIVHGDLRGVNIMIDSQGNALLTDFGLSVFAEGASESYWSMRGGHPAWLAPEILDPSKFGLKSSRPTYASDIYSFACVCIEVYTVKRPFPGMVDRQVYAAVVRGERPERPSTSSGELMPDSLWSLVDSCWSQTAGDRPDAMALLRRLDDLDIKIS